MPFNFFVCWTHICISIRQINFIRFVFLRVMFTIYVYVSDLYLKYTQKAMSTNNQEKKTNVGINAVTLVRKMSRKNIKIFISDYDQKVFKWMRVE